MPKAFLLLKVAPGSEDRVMKLSETLDNVEETCFVYGAYDIAMKLRANSVDELKDITTSKIKMLSDVRASVSLIILE